MSFKFDNFLNILLDYVKNNELPQIKFNVNTSLDDILNRIAGNAIYDSTKSKTELLKQFVNEIEQAQDSDIAIKGFEELDKIAESFANVIKDSRNEILNIKTSVEALVKQIKDKHVEYLKGTSIASIVNKIEADDNTFNKFNWKVINKLAPKNIIISAVHEFANINSPEASFFKCSNILNALNLKYKNQFKDLKSDKEYIKKTKESAVNAISEFEKDEIEKCIDILTSKMSFIKYVNQIETALSFKGNVGNNLVNITYNMPILVSVIDAINKSVIDVNDDIKNNVTIIDKYLFASAYVVIVTQDEYCKDALVLDNKMLNPDNYDKFKEQGGKPQDIVNYINYMYKAGVIPKKGININAILKVKDKLADRAEKDASKNMIQVKFETNQTLKQAMKKVLSQYISTIDKKNITYKYGIEDLTTRIIEKQVIEDCPIEDSVCNFIIELQYSNSFVKKLYKELGNEYLKKTMQQSVLTPEDALIAEVNVYAELITKFIIDKFVK